MIMYMSFSSSGGGSGGTGSGGTGSAVDSWIPTMALASAGLAACGVLALVALQSDICSRRFMSAEDLQVKRQNEYIYKWTHALQRAKLQVQYYLAGCGNNNSNGTTRTRKTVAQYKPDDEMARTCFISHKQTEELKDLVNKICSGKLAGLRVARIGKDTTRFASVSTSSEYYVWLIQQQQQQSHQEETVNSAAAAAESEDDDVYQVPLGPFCLLLAEAMENNITGTTFCFVSDASAGLASRLVVDVVAAAFKGTNTTSVVVATIEEPLWMACLAAILEQGVLSSTTSERILFALCRLEAATLSTLCSSKTATILVTLPGQATTATLLPLLQKVFPYDRHVFCYTGCIRTVEHAEWLRRCCRNPQSQRGYIPESLQEVLTLSHNPVIHTTPLLPSITSSGSASSAAAHRRSPLVRSSNVMPPFLSALKDLPIQYADTVETWMTAVDAFLDLKENEKRNGYQPYVLRLDYLLSAKSNSTEIKEGTDRYWSLLSLLQFVTGSKSRAMASEQIDAATSWLRQQNEQQLQQHSPSVVVLNTVDQRKIEHAVFQHKRILIENKTLLDTVQPKQHWSLKGAQKKGGCACCGPEDEEDDEEEEEKAGNTTITQSPFGMGDLGGARATATKKAMFVDGKMGFAFDPTKFNT